jgi:hypothetical protein
VVGNPVAEDNETDRDDGGQISRDFHDLLKATALSLPCPLQRSTYPGNSG